MPVGRTFDAKVEANFERIGHYMALAYAQRLPKAAFIVCALIACWSGPHGIAALEFSLVLCIFLGHPSLTGCSDLRIGFRQQELPLPWKLRPGDASLNHLRRDLRLGRLPIV